MAVIVDARVARFALPLLHPLVTSHGTISLREGALLRLRTSDGLEGWGEATPVPGFAGPDAHHSAEALEHSARALVGAEPEELWPPPVDLRFPAVAFALETAVADLRARRAGQSLAQFLSRGQAANSLDVNALISGPEAAHTSIADGYRTLKLKLGARTLAEDCRRLRALRDSIPSAIRVRVDANQAWSPADAARALADFEDLDIEYVEEPLRSPTAASLAALRAGSSVAIAADESATSAHEFEALLSRNAVDRVIIKPGVVGGLRAARARSEMCQEAGVAVVVTSGIEGAIATLAAIHLAASLPAPLPACGLATSGLLAWDLCRTPAPHRGVIQVPSTGGLGCAPDPVALVKAAA